MDKSKRVAVVGATGVLGRALLPLLVERGYTARAIVRSLTKAREGLLQDAEIAEGDLLAPDIEQQLPTLLEGCEVVLHIATAIPRDMSAPHAWDANTRLRTVGVRMLLQAALQAGVKQYLQQSITMAYPDHGDEWITEGMPLDTSRGRAGICAPVISMENLVRTLATDRLRWCILRGGSFVGPGTFQDHALADVRNRKQVVAGTGQNFVSLIHVADMASAVVAALEYAPDQSIFNIVEEPLREGEYLDRLAEAIGAGRPPRDTARPTPPSWRCSNQAARSILQWSPVHPLIPQPAQGLG
jgi:nucleoside-diphosphate-sugar epimerase